MSKGITNSKTEDSLFIFSPLKLLNPKLKPKFNNVKTLSDSKNSLSNILNYKTKNEEENNSEGNTTCISSNNKRVKFKRNFIEVIDVASYKEYNKRNEEEYYSYKAKNDLITATCAIY